MTPVQNLVDGARRRSTEVQVRCVVCRATSCETETVDALLPPVHLCRAHWAEYNCDWLLLGWCGDHYAEALKRCPTHGCVVEPL